MSAVLVLVPVAGATGAPTAAVGSAEDSPLASPAGSPLAKAPMERTMDKATNRDRSLLNFFMDRVLLPKMWSYRQTVY
jgi:hypothetical protein